MAVATVTNAGLNLMRDALLGNLVGTPVDTTIKYVAIGTGTTAPAATDTQLQTEVFRKAVTAYEDGAAVGEGLVIMSLGSSDSVGTSIGEIGWFAGSSATATANSGILVARGLYSHPHTNLESIQFTLDFTP